jgi:diguanylate cyclase (GGDEF)-like protein/PAS domain S-box-containing protein
LRKLSLKKKFLLAAVFSTVGGVVLMAGALWYQMTVDSGLITGIVSRESRLQVSRELEARAATVARYAADAVATPLARGDDAGVARALQPLLDDGSLLEVAVLDARQQTTFEWRRPGQPAADAVGTTELVARQQAPIRVMGPSRQGVSLPRTVGSVSVVLRSIGLPVTGALGELESARIEQLRKLGGVAAVILVLGLGIGGGIAWWGGRRIAEPLATLARGAERIGQGDYSRPLDVQRDDEIGDLQAALERMRHRLRSTTITRDYLNSVLGSMNDAVFVTSPDGVIRVVNLAGCRLLGYVEEELIGKSIQFIIDDSERPNFDLRQAAQDTCETLVRTRQGQSIPVSLSGSQIASDDPQFQGVIFAARNISERKRAERRIRYLARYDALTKIPNRMQFQHLLQQAIARGHKNGTSLALLYLDMDRFKEVNDTFGHAAGDRTLEILSERLTRSVPKEAVVGRLAGDEFALFIEGLPAAADNRGPIAHLARSVLNEVGKAFQLNDHEVFLTASFGIAFAPRDAENVIDLIRNADAAMYYSKQNGGNTFAFYAPEMNAAAVERLMLKSKLRRALERDELVLNYQPKVDLRTGRIVGAEALLRWRLPGHGDIPPSQFIPLAEETNLISELGEWVLNKVCSDYREMLGEVRNPGRFSLNLSLKQLQQASFILRCRSVFRRHGVSPTALELEITETTLMADVKRTLRLLNELYGMGLHLSIDDFGTGYSSLSALQQFPIGTLKVDQSFVRDLGDDEGDATIVRTIIEMGRSLGMEVIAEGVESRRHLDFLRAHHCNFAQGRLFGEPCLVEDLKALMIRQEAGDAPYAALLAAQDAGYEAGASSA